MSAEPPAALDGACQELSTAEVGHLSWYYDAPPGQHSPARPLLLVHSINAAGSAYEMKPLYDHYRRQRPVYALDLPGFGRSERSQRDYSPQLMAQAILALCQRIGEQHAAVALDAIALSLSCEYLARAAVAAPQRFHTLGLISPTGFNRRTLREGPTGSTLGLPWLYALLGQRRIGRRIFGLLTRRAIIAYFLRRTWGARSIDVGLLDYDYAITRGPGAHIAPLRFLSGFLFSGDSGTLYRALTQPVWVVHGVRGDFVDYRGLDVLRGQPNWTIEVLPTGALPQFEQLDELVRRFEAWYRAQP